MTTLVIDVGSSSIRALLFDSQARLIPEAIARRQHRFTRDATADAEQMRHLVEACIGEILEHPQAQDIMSVGMATFVGNLLGVDGDNKPLTPLYTYADTSSSEDAVLLSNSYDMPTIHARTGCRIHPAYHPAKFHWLKRTQPEVFNPVSRWTDFATYCYTTWFGRDVPCSYSVASWSGLLVRQALTWDKTWLDALDIEENLFPRLADFNTSQSGLADLYHTRWKPLRNADFYLAVGDGAAANIGSGGISPEKPVLTIGTTSAIRIVTPNNDDVASGLWAYRVDATRHLVGGATNEGGNIVAWARNALQLDTKHLDDAILARKPGEHGLTILPFLAGERSPGYRAEATGTIHGLRLDTQPIDIFHGLLESVALRLKLIYDLMKQPGNHILAGGGALTQSQAWAQIMADVLGVPIHLCESSQVTARGVALLIHFHLEQTSPIEPGIINRFSPRPAMTQIYSNLLSQHKTLYNTLY